MSSQKQFEEEDVAMNEAAIAIALPMFRYILQLPDYVLITGVRLDAEDGMLYLRVESEAIPEGTVMLSPIYQDVEIANGSEHPIKARRLLHIDFVEEAKVMEEPDDNDPSVN